MDIRYGIRYFLIAIALIMALQECVPRQDHGKLPILGRKEIQETKENGSLTYDTIYHTIADFSFVDQDSNEVTNATFRNKIYVADFFFTTCPTICPIMKTQMLRVYEYFMDNDKVMFLSHTIDPDYDSVAVLHNFAERLGVSSTKWHFVTGLKEDIYDIGQRSYMVTAMEDEDEPGGYLHSGAFILVDGDRRVRGMYDGTSEDDVDRLIRDIPKLLEEYDI
jgi:protein SCO1/2